MSDRVYGASVYDPSYVPGSVLGVLLPSAKQDPYEYADWLGVYIKLKNKLNLIAESKQASGGTGKTDHCAREMAAMLCHKSSLIQWRMAWVRPVWVEPCPALTTHRRAWSPPDYASQWTTSRQGSIATDRSLQVRGVQSPGHHGDRGQKINECQAVGNSASRPQVTHKGTGTMPTVCILRCSSGWPNESQWVQERDSAFWWSNAKSSPIVTKNRGEKIRTLCFATLSPIYMQRHKQKVIVNSTYLQSMILKRQFIIRV